MGTVNLPLSMHVGPTEIFEEMPAGFRAFLNRGFADLALLPYDKVERLSTLIAGGFEQTDDKTAAESAKLLGIAQEEVPKIAAALGLLIAFTTRRTDVEAVLQQGVHVGAIRSENLIDLSRLAEKLTEKKGDFKEALEVASLAKEVAPSFERLSLSVELRFAFEDNVPVRSVPIVLCHLATDSEPDNVFFQMRKHDLVRMIDQLNTALQNVDVLQKRNSSNPH